MVLLDAGPSMATALRERGARNGVSGARLVTTRFDAAVAAVESVVQQKVRSFTSTVCMMILPAVADGVVAGSAVVLQTQGRNRHRDLRIGRCVCCLG